MARPLRSEYDGASSHVTSRGNERKPIFKDNTDREVFFERIHWICPDCLMDNQYHLVIETPDWESLPGDAPAQGALHPNIQSVSPSGGASVSGAVQKNFGPERQPLPRGLTRR